MKQLIKDIIDQFGGRQAGSPAEKKAQLYFKEQLDRFCDSTLVQEFPIHLQAKFGSLRLFCLVYYICLLLFLIYPVAAFVIALINSILFFAHFVLYYDVLDPIFPKGQSLNVVGTIEPKEEAKSTILFSGHMDSTPEFIWWYRLKKAGLIMTLVTGFLIALLLPLFLGINLITGTGTVMLVIYALFVLSAPITITMFQIHGNRVVDGAGDNLSGVAMAYELGKYFAKDENRLKHTRIKVAAWGSEEIGLKGAQAYANKYNEELIRDNTVNINMDGILHPDQFHLVDQEIMLLSKFTPELIQSVEASFKASNIKSNRGNLLFGGTDGTSFIRAGIPAVSIIAMSLEELDPTYHTRLDEYDCVNEEALSDLHKVLVHYANEVDKK